ncbi:MAG TPA: hypothetical protein VGM70_08955 [Pseudolysinimonas sp.]
MSISPSSAGPILFHPEPLAGHAVLFVADSAQARVLAFELPPETSAGGGEVQVEQLGARLAALLGVERGGAVIRGIAVHPESRAVYLSVARGRGADSAAAIVRVGAGGVLELVELSGLPVSSVELDDAPAPDDERVDAWLDGTDESSAAMEIRGTTLQIARVPVRRSTITDLAWVDGRLAVAGLSNEEFSSRLRLFPYPFDGSEQAASVEIFHVDHGRYETESPIRALVGYGSGVLATYTCTPVVHFPLGALSGNGPVRGRTIAELGPMNQPFSIVTYDRDGEEYVLVSNTRHPLLRIPASAIAEQPHLEVPLSDPAHSLGVPRDELPQAGVTWMANLDRGNIVVVQSDDDDTHLRTLAAASL